MAEKQKMQLALWLRALIIVVTLAVISFFAVAGLASVGDSSGHLKYVYKHWNIFLGGAAAIFVIVFLALLRGYKYILQTLCGGGAGMSGMFFLAGDDVKIRPVISPENGILFIILGFYIWLSIRLLRGKVFSDGA